MENEEETILSQKDIEEGIETEMEDFEDESDPVKELRDEVKQLKKMIRKKQKEKQLSGVKNEIQKIKQGLGESEDISLIEGEIEGPETKVQLTSSSYTSTIPRDICREFNIRKGDRLKWTKANFKGKKVIMISVNYTGKDEQVRAPFDERVIE